MSRRVLLRRPGISARGVLRRRHHRPRRQNQTPLGQPVRERQNLRQVPLPAGLLRCSAQENSPPVLQKPFPVFDSELDSHPPHTPSSPKGPPTPDLSELPKKFSPLRLHFQHRGLPLGKLREQRREDPDVEENPPAVPVTHLCCLFLWLVGPQQPRNVESVAGKPGKCGQCQCVSFFFFFTNLFTSVT